MGGTEQRGAPSKACVVKAENVKWGNFKNTLRS